jgi:hypothetical protein
VQVYHLLQPPQLAPLWPSLIRRFAMCAIATGRAGPSRACG